MPRQPMPAQPPQQQASTQQQQGQGADHYQIHSGGQSQAQETQHASPWSSNHNTLAEVWGSGPQATMELSGPPHSQLQLEVIARLRAGDLDGAVAQSGRPRQAAKACGWPAIANL